MPAIAGSWAHILAAGLLIACTAAPQPQSARQAYRAAGAPIYSTSGLPIARMLGTWRQMAGFGASHPCSASPALQITPDAGSARVQYDLCLGQTRLRGQGTLASAGAQGRYRVQGLPAPLWVLWMDEGNRSMAIGTPDGSFGMVLSKDAIPADRARAAREILAWNGYDLTQFYQY